MTRLGAWLERRWDRWADERHSSEALATAWHGAHARVLSIKLVLAGALVVVLVADAALTAAERKWHRVAARRHRRAMERQEVP